MRGALTVPILYEEVVSKRLKRPVQDLHTDARLAPGILTVIQLLKKLQEKYQLSYLFISHDLKVVKSLCHHLIVMKAGETVEVGPAEQVFERPEHPYTKELMETAFA